MIFSFIKLDEEKFSLQKSDAKPGSPESLVNGRGVRAGHVHVEENGLFLRSSNSIRCFSLIEIRCRKLANQSFETIEFYLDNKDKAKIIDLELIERGRVEQI